MGAAGSVMSGSGPSVFAIFSDKTKALEALKYFKKKYRHSYFLDMYKTE